MIKRVRNVAAVIFVITALTLPAGAQPAVVSAEICQEYGYSCFGKNYTWKVCQTNCDDELDWCIDHCDGAPEYWSCEDDDGNPPSTGSCYCEFPCVS